MPAGVFVFENIGNIPHEHQTTQMEPVPLEHSGMGTETRVSSSIQMHACMHAHSCTFMHIYMCTYIQYSVYEYIKMYIVI